MGRVVGVDMGGTKTALWVWDAEMAAPVGEHRFPTRRDAGPDSLWAELCQEIRSLLHRTETRNDTLLAIGAAVPGCVDEQGTVLDGGKLVGWKGWQMRERLARAFHVPAFVEQDANAAALGEQWRGNAQSLRDFVFLALGTGVGAGVVLGGNLHRGAHCAAGEVGDLVPDRHRLGKGHPNGHRVSSVVGGQVIRDRVERALGERLGTSEALRFAQKDPELEAVAEEVFDYVALTVIAVSALIDPQAVILGGGTASAGELLLEQVRGRVEAELRVAPEIKLSALGESAQLYGAVYGALKTWEIRR
jgi:glucokinase